MTTTAHMASFHHRIGPVRKRLREAGELCPVRWQKTLGQLTACRGCAVPHEASLVVSWVYAIPFFTDDEPLGGDFVPCCERSMLTVIEQAQHEVACLDVDLLSIEVVLPDRSRWRK